jgi:hypothetical protein
MDLHWLPAYICHEGQCQVKKYFLTQDPEGKLVSSLRGRRLIGKQCDPSGFYQLGNVDKQVTVGLPVNSAIQWGRDEKPVFGLDELVRVNIGLMAELAEFN